MEETFLARAEAQAIRRAMVLPRAGHCQLEMENDEFSHRASSYGVAMRVSLSW